MITTKIYKNTTDKDMDVVGIGEVPANEQVSISTEYHQPVVLENYPGLIDVLAEEEKANAKKAEKAEAKNV